MLKKLMITTALSGLMIGAAAAQSTQPSDTMTAPSATTTAPSAGGAKFINSQTGDQWLSSSFIGMDVVGPDDGKIGDIVDILFDKNGNVVGYVVGVGGFLGIGQKNVALAPSSFQPVPGSGSSTTGSASSASSDAGKLKLNMTKDQLQQAAAFETQRDQESKARSGSQSAPGGGMNRTAPK